jgi:hypothetical protein
MSAISARSRSLACVDVSILSISARTSAGSSTGVCPVVTTWPARAPGQKSLRSAGIGAARVRVGNVGREEFEKTHGRALAGGGDERRKN